METRIVLIIYGNSDQNELLLHCRVSQELSGTSGMLDTE